MYNKRINDWKIHKNYKKSEKAAMVRAFKVDKASNKTGSQSEDTFASDLQLTGLTFKSRPIKVDRLVRYMRETHSSNSDPRPIFGVPADPTKLIIDYGKTREIETLYRCASQHLEFYLASRIALRPSSSQNMPHGLANTLLAGDGKIADGLDEDLLGFNNKLYIAIELHCLGRISAALRVVNEAIDNVRSLFFRQHPNLLNCFFYIHHITRRADLKLMQSIWNFVIDMAKIMLGSSHPVVIASAILQTLTDDNFKISVWRTLNDILRNGLGEEDVAVLGAQNWYIPCLVLLGMDEDALQHIGRMSAGKSNSERQNYRLQGLSLAMLRRYDEAELKLRKYLEMRLYIQDDILTWERSQTEAVLRDIAAAMAELALVLERQGKSLAAEEQWLATLSFNIQALDLFDPSVCEKISYFERFLMRNKEYEEAAALRSQYPHVFQ
jgi:hypothetical protein